MRTRPARPEDIPAITLVQRGQDEFWFGAAEFDESEIREEFEPIADWSAQTVVVHDSDVDDGDLLGAGWWWGSQTYLLATAGPNRPAVIEQLLDALDAAGVKDVFALSRDTELVSAITEHGWRHTHSSFDLFRAVEPDWTLPEPTVPVGVELTAVAETELSALHSMIYDDARWADVTGHVRRGFDEWHALFWKPGSQAEVIGARRDGRLVGAAITRTYSDGTGMINQLAVSAAERRAGLGRALLLAGLRNRRAAGATRLGLGVQGANEHALALYESVGLRIEREYRSYER